METEGRKRGMVRVWLSMLVLLSMVAAAHLGSAVTDPQPQVGQTLEASVLNSVWIASASAQSPNCMEDVVEALDGANAVPLNCTANDVNLAIYHVLSGPPSCVAGEYVTVQLRAEAVAGASERYDIGLYVALDGGDALRGECHQAYLPPPLKPDASNPNPTCSVSTTTACLTDGDCPLGETCVGGYNPGAMPPGLAGGPFFNAELAEDAGDTCGDLEQGVPAYADLPELTIKCQDADGDGYADVSSCVSWENGKSAGTANKPSCTDQLDTRPSTKAKCRCAPVRVGDIEALGRILVDKVTEPPDSPSVFDFSLSGGPDDVNQTFSLTDDSAPYDSGGLPASDGTPYSVVEMEPAHWHLTSTTCTGDNGTPDDPDDDRTGIDPNGIDLQSGETVTCQFLNTSTTSVSLSTFTANPWAGAILVQWRTATEIDTLGFNLYRAAAPDGERIRLNADLITSRTAPGSPVGAAYAYEDTEAELGVLYSYWLEDLEIDGSASLHGPVSAGIFTLAIDPGLWSLGSELSEAGE